MKQIFITIIRFYKTAISPWVPPACRFEPTCSRYAEDAINQKGVIRGFFLAGIRFLKCHPFHSGGYDPVG